MSGTLEIVEYDGEWERRFEAEHVRIASALGAFALRIDHSGSTSVPGLAAKPVIDIQVSVASLQPLAAFGDPLERLGYVHVPHPDDAFCPYFHRPAVWPHTYHVHVVASGGLEERRTLAFRDYLRAHTEVAREYERLKRGLAPCFDAAQHAGQQAYSDAKSAFIEEVIRRALAEGHPRDLRFGSGRGSRR